MPRRIPENIRIKRKYLVWLKDARGLSDATVDKAAAAISVYEAYLDGKDFRSFHAERARAFKRHLASRANRASGTPISEATAAAILRDVKSFFLWLADQPGYKSRVSHADAAYFSAPRKVDNARRGGLWKPHPSPKQVVRVLSKMPAETIVERRDRALVAFLFLTGSRDGAVITLQLRHVDLDNACIHFDGRSVDTKFGKCFTTVFFPFGPVVERIVRDWIDELVDTHGFGPCDPIFPKTRIGLSANRRFAAAGLDRAPWAGASSVVRIFKAAFVVAGLPPFSPHRVRDTIAEFGSQVCRSPEEYKAWSQNMGHDNVLTTFMSYGGVAPGRQVELMTRFRNWDDVIETP